MSATERLCECYQKGYHPPDGAEEFKSEKDKEIKSEKVKEINETIHGKFTVIYVKTKDYMPAAQREFIVNYLSDVKTLGIQRTQHMPPIGRNLIQPCVSLLYTHVTPP